MNKYLVITLISTFLLTSCFNKEKRTEDEINTVPEAFEDESIVKDISSFKRGYESVTEKLYQELLEKDESLKAIEKKIKQLEKDVYEDNIELNKFFSNNNEYYNDIKSNSETVKDTILRDLLVQKINESEHNYSEKISEVKSLKEILNYKIEVLKDYRTAMKIILTEQSMHEYQTNFKQDTSKLHTLIQRYENLTKDIQSKITE